MAGARSKSRHRVTLKGASLFIWRGTARYFDAIFSAGLSDCDAPKQRLVISILERSSFR